MARCERAKQTHHILCYENQSHITYLFLNSMRTWNSVSTMLLGMSPVSIGLPFSYCISLWFSMMLSVPELTVWSIFPQNTPGLAIHAKDVIGSSRVFWNVCSSLIPESPGKSMYWISKESHKAADIGWSIWPLIAHQMSLYTVSPTSKFYRFYQLRLLSVFCYDKGSSFTTHRHKYRVIVIAFTSKTRSG